MMKLTFSPAAAGLLRAFLVRGGVDRDRILLTELRSVDWQSLTFIGERHELELRVPGPDAAPLVQRLIADLADAELLVPGHIVADIGLERVPIHNRDGSISLHLEALTVAE